MTTNIIWSLTNGGDQITENIDHGNLANGEETTEVEIYLRHDNALDITDAGIYVREISGNYVGDFTPGTDIAEILAWGDASTASAFGGVLLNMNATTAYSSGWATYNDKSPSGGFVCRSGVGDSEGNAIPIPITAGAPVEGEIPAGLSPNVRFRMKILSPSDEDTAGSRFFETVLRYNTTS